MCIALTEFTGLCGFRPQAETVEFVKNIPELASLLNGVELNVDAAAYPAALKQAFTNLMETKKETIVEKVNSFVARVQVKKSEFFSIKNSFSRLIILPMPSKSTSKACFLL